MKKALAMLLALVLVFALTACGGGKTPTDPTDPGQSSGTEPDSSDGGNTDPGTAASAKNLSEIYDLFETIYNGMGNSVDALVEKSFSAGRIDSDAVYFLPFVDVGLSSFLYTTCFDNDDMEITRMAVSFFTSDDITIDETGGGYLLKYTNSDGEAVEIKYAFDLATSSIGFSETTDGTVTDFFDMVGLGGGRYALMSEHERAFVTLDGEDVTSFYYSSLLDSYDGTSYSYDYPADSIYGKSAPDESWILERKASDQIEEVWDMREENKLIITTLLDSEYDLEADQMVYFPLETPEEEIIEA